MFFFNVERMKFPRNITHLLLCSILIVLSGVIVVACQKPTADIIQESKEPKKEVKTVPDLTQICQNLKKEMLDINAQRTTLAIEQVNQDIRMCLPLMKPVEQIELISLSNKMYQQFLEIDRNSEQQLAFENYVLDQAAYPTIQQSHFETLHIRDQYLLRHKGQAYIELVERPNHDIIYHRSPQYLAKVFAPYLPESEKVFIENLAEQNSQALFKDDQLMIDAEEIGKRAKFWQDYIQNFPESLYLSDAKLLKNIYSNLLFFGTQHASTSSSNNFENQSDIDASYWFTIENLAKSNEAELSNQAKKFVQFINMAADHRQQNIQLNEKERNNLEKEPLHLARVQLSHYLNLDIVDLNKVKRDCLSDAICH